MRCYGNSTSRCCSNYHITSSSSGKSTVPPVFSSLSPVCDQQDIQDDIKNTNKAEQLPKFPKPADNRVEKVKVPAAVNRHCLAYTGNVPGIRYADASNARMPIAK